MKRNPNVAASNIAAYAENPKKFAQAGGRPYDIRLARIGTAAHGRIGKGPSKVLLIITAVVVVAALAHFGLIEI